MVSLTTNSQALILYCLLSIGCIIWVLGACVYLPIFINRLVNMKVHVYIISSVVAHYITVCEQLTLVSAQKKHVFVLEML